MRNERILVTRSSLPPFEEYVEEIRSVFETHWLTNMGEKHRILEGELKRFLNAEHLCLFQNGHLALEMSLQAMGIQGEVITTPFTFASTTWAILRAGCKPVFCDINPVNYTLDPEQVEARITERTTAILPVHVYGHLCNVEALKEIADRRHLKLIYDAAHAFGVRYRGKSAACFGDLSMYSFHATKVFHTIEGGAVTFRDPELEDRLFRIKNFGIQENVTYGVGGNAKMNEFEAAMGICNLRHLEEEIQRREQRYLRYMERLRGIEGITVSEVPEETESNYAYFPVLFDAERFGESRDAVCERLNRNEIYPRKYFWPCTNAFDFQKEFRDPESGAPQFCPEETPIAARVSSQVLTLPIYASLPLEAVDKICTCILEGRRASG